MTDPILLNPGVRYRVTRNVPATNAHGQPCLIALVSVEFINGFEKTLAVDEGLIAFAGEGIIENEVKRFLSKR